jgi:hypothetical protein
MESLARVWFFFVEISPNGEFFFLIGENLVFIEFLGHQSFFQKITNFFIKLQHVTKTARFSFTFIFSYYRIWLNLCVDDHHFDSSQIERKNIVH